MGPGCNIPGCTCTHDGGCDRGWISLDDEYGNDLGKTAPCPNCRPGLREVVDKGWSAADRASRIARLRAFERVEFAQRAKVANRQPVAATVQAPEAPEPMREEQGALGRW